MAENKKSFLLYADYLSNFENLDDIEAGKLIKHILRYVNDLKPESPDKITTIAFEPIKLQLKRDLQKWDEIKEKRSNAGKISAEKRQQTPTNSTCVESVEQTPTNSTVTVTVNDTVTVINKVVIPDKSEVKKFLVKENSELDKKIDLVIDKLNLELNKNYRYDTKNSRNLISKVIEAGYTGNQIWFVIENQKRRWFNDSKMSQWLTCKTLFAMANFEEYVNQKPFLEQLPAIPRHHDNGIDNG